jgi:hypothetical protein
MKSIIAVFVFFILVNILLLTFFHPHPPDKECMDHVNVLRQKNDSIAHEKLLLSSEITRLNDQADSLKMKTEQSLKTIIQLKKSRNENIQNINRFNADELADFFARVKTDSTAN